MTNQILIPIHTEEKAYILGWLASDKTKKESETLTLNLTDDEETVVSQLKSLLSESLEISPSGEKISILISSSQLSAEVNNLLQIENNQLSLPQLQSESLSWAFIRGYFDAQGIISSIDAMQIPCCKLKVSSSNLRTQIQQFGKMISEEFGDTLIWRGNNALDFLGKLYEEAQIYLTPKRNLYLDWASWIPGLSGIENKGKLKNFRWAKSHPHAVPPFKERVSDSGYDLTVIEMIEQRGDIQIYDTGIKVQPEYGWYFIIAPRSSLFKRGYIPAITTGIIDRTYVGSIKVPLLKFDKNAPDLTLPARIMQIIPTPIIHVEMIQVENFEETNRSSGGLGSSGD